MAGAPDHCKLRFGEGTCINEAASSLNELDGPWCLGPRAYGAYIFIEIDLCIPMYVYIYIYMCIRARQASPTFAESMLRWMQLVFSQRFVSVRQVIQRLWHPRKNGKKESDEQNHRKKTLLKTLRWFNLYFYTLKWWWSPWKPVMSNRWLFVAPNGAWCRCSCQLSRKHPRASTLSESQGRFFSLRAA